MGAYLWHDGLCLSLCWCVLGWYFCVWLVYWELGVLAVCLFVCVCVREGGRRGEKECITWRVLPITPLSWRSRRREGEIISFFFSSLNPHSLPARNSLSLLQCLLSSSSPNLPIFPSSVSSSLYLPSAFGFHKAGFSPDAGSPFTTCLTQWGCQCRALRQRNADLSCKKVESGSTFFSIT